MAGVNSEKVLQQAVNEDLFTFAQYDEKEAERGGYSNYSYWRSTWNVFAKNKMALFLLISIGLLLLFTIIQPYLPGQGSPIHINLDPATKMPISNLKPSAEYLFGTNSIGQDLWARLWSGTRTSLFIGIVVGIWELVVGVIIGALWGYVPWLDRPITEIYNVLDNIPVTILLILLTYIMRPSLSTMIFAMCLTGWVQMARFIRNLVIMLRDREYNLASKCLGTPTGRIISKNLLPYLVSVIMLRFALSIPQTIGYEVFLTYIGLGLPLSVPSLGNLVQEGRILMMVPDYRYQLILPSIAISFITISFYILGNVFSDAADPRNHV